MRSTARLQVGGSWTPFYQAWNRGELTAEALRDYACQYYQHVAAFPMYLSAVHSGTDDVEARRHLLDNLNDEEAGHANHPELWLQFARAVGVHPGEAEGTVARDETRALVETFRFICPKRSTAEGLASLYAYESQIPEVSQTKIAGLRRFYGVTSADGTAYFDVHIGADREHSRRELQLLNRLVNEENGAAAQWAVDLTLHALWEFLSGVCRHNTIAC